jgi:hypothetical protein
MFTLKLFDPEGVVDMEEVVIPGVPYEGYEYDAVRAYDYTAQLKNQGAKLDKAEKKWRFERIDAIEEIKDGA